MKWNHFKGVPPCVVMAAWRNERGESLSISSLGVPEMVPIWIEEVYSLGERMTKKDALMAELVAALKIAEPIVKSEAAKERATNSLNVTARHAHKAILAALKKARGE